MPCSGCEKECKCTTEKCAENCKCNSPGKCGCNATNVAQSSGGSCCKKIDAGDGKTAKVCCKDAKKE